MHDRRERRDSDWSSCRQAHSIDKIGFKALVYLEKFIEKGLYIYIQKNTIKDGMV